MDEHVEYILEMLAGISTLVPELVDAAEASGNTPEDCWRNLCRAKRALAAIADLVIGAELVMTDCGSAH